MCRPTRKITVLRQNKKPWVGGTSEGMKKRRLNLSRRVMLLKFSYGLKKEVKLALVTKGRPKKKCDKCNVTTAAEERGNGETLPENNRWNRKTG